MSIKLSSTLPKGTPNGLGPIVRDLAAAQVLMEHALERRTGRVALPLDLEEELAAAFQNAASAED